MNPRGPRLAARGSPGDTAPRKSVPTPGTAAVLTELTVKNFRGLRDVTVPLKPLTVLIGPNDSGKSTLLEAVDTLFGWDESAVHGGLELPRADHWNFDFQMSVMLQAAGVGGVVAEIADADDGEVSRRGSEEVDSPGRRYSVFGGGSSVRYDRISVNPLELCFSGEQIVHDVPFMSVRIESDGSNVPGLLDKMLRSHRPRFEAIVAKCRELVPGFRDFSINLPKHGEVELYLWLDGGIELPTDRASAGVRALIFYLTLAHRPGRPDIVLVEEPENGVHPERLGEIMTLLRLLTEPKDGEPGTQVILTTHSPFLLDHVNLETDQVLVFRREADGARTAHPADAEGLREFTKYSYLGELWSNFKEEGLLRPEDRLPDFKGNRADTAIEHDVGRQAIDSDVRPAAEAAA